MLRDENLTTKTKKTIFTLHFSPIMTIDWKLVLLAKRIIISYNIRQQTVDKRLITARLRYMYTCKDTYKEWTQVELQIYGEK